MIRKDKDDAKKELDHQTHGRPVYPTLRRKPPHLPTKPLLADSENPRHAIQVLCRGITRKEIMHNMSQFVIRKDQNTWSMNDQPEAKLVERWGGCIVVKIPGHMEHHGIGLRTYKPAEYQVWQITDIEDKGEILVGHADFLINFPVNPKQQTKEFDHHRSTA